MVFEVADPLIPPTGIKAPLDADIAVLAFIKLNLVAGLETEVVAKIGGQGNLALTRDLRAAERPGALDRKSVV